MLLKPPELAIAYGDPGAARVFPNDFFHLFYSSGRCPIHRVPCGGGERKPLLTP